MKIWKNDNLNNLTDCSNEARITSVIVTTH